MRRALAIFLALSALHAADFKLTNSQYEDRIRAAWLAQMAGALMGFQFEHKPAATAWVDTIPSKFKDVPIDDDFYYEMVAIRGFERYGTQMTAEQLGEQWKLNSAGSWGSSEQARLLLAKGMKAPDTGHPRYNKLWFSIGPQFSAEVYGLLAPGMPNLAAKLARQYGHVNGYAEGVDGAIFVAGMVSLAFTETDPRQIVKKAAQLIHPSSPYRQCLDTVVNMAERGATPRQIADAVEDRWHFEYPATNNAVANGGIVALSVWFGEGDFLQTVNHAYRAADFTDADCNAANGAAVVAVMKGTKAYSAEMLRRLGDRVQGAEMGGVQLTPPVDESITELAKRTAAIGRKFIVETGGQSMQTGIRLQTQAPQTQPAERFELADLTQYWNPDWKLVRAGFGGAGGGMKNLHGNTYLDGDTLATYPKDETRGLVLTRDVTPKAASILNLEAAADSGRAWGLDIYIDNIRVESRIIESKGDTRTWQRVEVPLANYNGKKVNIRLFQLVLLGPKYAPGNAYWRNLQITD